MIKFDKDLDCNAVITTADGQEMPIRAYRLFDAGLAKWKGWECHAGKDMIFVDHDFTVFGGQCRNDYLGNLFDANFKLLSDPTICKRQECTPCEADLLVKKQQQAV
jgi:hypothetical protein